MNLKGNKYADMHEYDDQSSIRTVLHCKRCLRILDSYLIYLLYRFLLAVGSRLGDYSNVKGWYDNTDSTEQGFPKTVDEYFSFIENELDFLKKKKYTNEGILLELVNP